ncbi:MAG TPA: Xaa-Pro peptidase family protein [Chitinivibrionales bacterium]|nr:Xaa-Pro peptidase family protein [Chitinivibrionales bacterium]
MANKRLSRIKDFLDKGSFASVFISDTVDVEYLTGFRSSNAYCIVTRRHNLLCSDFRYREAAVAFCRKRREWKFLEIKENDFSSLAGAFGAQGPAGFQSHVMTVDQFRLLRARCPGVQFLHLPREFQDIFTPKMPGEILCMRKAAAIGDKAFAAVLRSARPGITEIELAAVCEDACRRLGSERPSFDTIVLFGRRAALPHGRPSNVRLRRGDWVLCDFGCTVSGFASDMTRTFVMGKASALQKKLYAVVLRAQEIGRHAVAAAVRASDIDKCVRLEIARAGYAPLFGHATGHGLGLRVHEKPRIGGNDKTILQSGTVITIEPGIYHRRFGGVRIEDMVVVRDHGGEVLTKSPRHLIEAGTK